MGPLMTIRGMITLICTERNSDLVRRRGRHAICMSGFALLATPNIYLGQYQVEEPCLQDESSQYHFCSADYKSHDCSSEDRRLFQEPNSSTLSLELRIVIIAAVLLALSSKLSSDYLSTYTLSAP